MDLGVLMDRNRSQLSLVTRIVRLVVTSDHCFVQSNLFQISVLKFVEIKLSLIGKLLEWFKRPSC